jgi:hypothetical protein
MRDRLKLAALLGVAVLALGALGVVVYNFAANGWRLHGNPLDLSFLDGGGDEAPEPDERSVVRSMRFGDTIEAVHVVSRELRVRIGASHSGGCEVRLTLTGDATDSTLFPIVINARSRTLEIAAAPSSAIGSAAGIIDIALPRRMAITVDARNGDVTLENVAGMIDVRTDTGGIDLTGLEGRVNCVSAGGTIALEGCRLDTATLTSGGDVSLDLTDGPIAVDARRLYAQRHFGALSVTARSGITADLLSMESPARLSTDAGDIRLRVLGGARFAYDVEAPTGTIVSNVTFDSLRAEDVTEHTLRATSNGGGAPIVLRAKRGNVEIAVFTRNESTLVHPDVQGVIGRAAVVRRAVLPLSAGTRRTMEGS